MDLMEPPVSFGQWVRMRRTALRLTQGELARRVYCSEITIRKIESDERRPSPEIAHGLAGQLHLPSDLIPRFLRVARSELSADHLPLLQNEPAHPRHWLPVISRADLAMPATTFLGRTKEVAQVCTLLQAPELRLLSLVGPPGIGKSRLSLHVAVELSDAFLHGATFVPLAPLRDAELVPDAIAQLFGFAESGFSTPLEYLRAELRQRHLLLVLDNFEQVLPARRYVQELMAMAPQLKILVTSRVALGVPVEQVFPVPPLGTPAAGESPSALAAIRFPAVQLLVSRARAASPAFTLTTDNAGAIAAICARLDGLPLAMELVAPRLKTTTPDALLARLTDWLAAPADAATELPERHRTLRSAIAWSYDLLPAPAQVVFVRLGVFVNGATPALACSICGAGEVAPDAVIAQIELLVDHNLVRAEADGAGGTRYTMLATVLDYAREQLAARSEQAQCQQRHAEAYRDFALAAAPKILGQERGRWIDAIEQDNDNLRAALRWAEEQGDVVVLTELVAALGWFWELQGRRLEARAWLQVAAATPAERQPPPARARLLHMLGHLAGEEGDLESSRRFAVESLALANALGDAWTAALAERDLDWVLFAADNNVDGAVALAERAAAALLEAGDLRNHLLSLLDAATIWQQSGNTSRGLPYAEKALSLAQQWADEPLLCEAVSTVGLLAHTAGDHERALVLLEENLARASRQPNGKQIAWGHYRLAQVLVDHGDLERAADHFAESSRLWSDRNEVLAVAYCRSGEANCLMRQGDVAQAVALYESTLLIYRQFDVPRAVAWTLWNLAHAAATTGDDARVTPLLQESLAIFCARYDEQGVACCEKALAGGWELVREPVRP